MPKILVVDDEPPLLKAYSRILEKAGHEVVQAATGEEALSTCEREEPALVLLDAMLPDLDGLEVCRRIKQDCGLDSTFVIMISGRRTSPEE